MFTPFSQDGEYRWHPLAEKNISEPIFNHGRFTELSTGYQWLSTDFLIDIHNLQKFGTRPAMKYTQGVRKNLGHKIW